MISVIIPLYNKRKTIARTLNSVLNQSFQDFEIIVVDDGSNDNGHDVVTSFNDNRIRLVRQANSGVSAARNRGIEESKNDLITFIDADDEWDCDFLKTVTDMEQQFPQCKVFATSYRTSRNSKTSCLDSNDKQYASNVEHTYRQINNYFELAANSAPPFCSISVLIRKDALLAIGGFPVGIYQGEDLMTWARLAIKNNIVYCSTPHCTFHVDETKSMGIPKRVPTTNDVVGNELEKLYTQAPDTAGLKQYIALWHKMRASMFLRLPNCRKQCISEINISRNWHPIRKLFIYRLLLLVPYPLRMKILTLNP